MYVWCTVQYNAVLYMIDKPDQMGTKMIGLLHKVTGRRHCH
jgi:hypothetical protein